MKRIFIIGLSLFLFFSCGKKKDKRFSREIRPAVKKGYVRKKKEEEKKEEMYVYQGYKYRNPFYPLVGATSGTKVKQVAEAPSTGINIDAFALQGIMVDSEGKKYALLVGGDGLPYVLKGRKLIDVNGEIVPGVTGSVMEKKVIIIKGGKTITLALPENQ